MTKKRIKTQIINRHDIAENWAKAVNFVPKQGEPIVYDDRYTDADGNEVIVASAVGYKIGDGVTKVHDLPFLGNPVSVYSKGLAFTSNGDGTCYVSGIGSCTDTDVVIPPASPAGDSVIRIRELAFLNCSSVASVIIPGSVTSIGQQALKGCTSLTSIEIPDSVTSIGEQAFWSCESLSSVVIPESVTSIGNEAFYCCKALKSVTFANGGQLSAIGSYMFSGCRSLTSIEIPASVTEIGVGVFNKCTSLTSIEIPDSVTSIGNSAFQYCESLTSIEMPASVTSIGDYAFYNCNSLSDVYYTGGEEEWAAISIDAENECLMNATIHYNFIDSFYKVTNEINEIKDKIDNVKSVITKEDVTTALGYTPLQNIPSAGEELGGVKTGGDVSINDGIITVNQAQTAQYAGDNISAGTIDERLTTLTNMLSDVWLVVSFNETTGELVTKSAGYTQGS